MEKQVKNIGGIDMDRRMSSDLSASSTNHPRSFYQRMKDALLTYLL